MSIPIKVTITKENAMGEKITFETSVLPTRNHQDLYETFLPMFRALDLRQFEMNQRVLEVNKRMGKLDEEHYAMMREILAGFNNIVFEEPAKPIHDSVEQNGA